MGKTTSYKPRKATFTVTGKGKERIFTPVNKRAHTVARKLGKRTKVTTDDIKRAKGSYKLCVYNAEGELKAIRV